MGQRSWSRWVQGSCIGEKDRQVRDTCLPTGSSSGGWRLAGPQEAAHRMAPNCCRLARGWVRWADPAPFWPLKACAHGKFLTMFQSVGQRTDVFIGTQHYQPRPQITLSPRVLAPGPCRQVGADSQSGGSGWSKANTLEPQPTPTTLNSDGQWSVRWSVTPPSSPQSPAAERNGS